MAAKRMLYLDLETCTPKINPEHLKLLVDKMTFKGRLMPITRYSMRVNDVGPLSKATFEESMDNLLKAAFDTETDNVKSISSRIITGNMMNHGTGICDVLVNLGQLEKQGPMTYKASGYKVEEKGNLKVVYEESDPEESDPEEDPEDPNSTLDSEIDLDEDGLGDDLTDELYEPNEF